LFAVPIDQREEERTRLSKKYLSASNPDNIQGKVIPGTEHPINYYFITDKATYDDQNRKADAVFDIERDVFVKRPEDFTFDVDMYIGQFTRKVQELDIVKGELTRDIIDYNELKDLQPNDVLNLQDKVKDKLEEIEDDLRVIIRIGDGVDTDRRAAFDTDMAPDEIRDYGVKNRLPKNVIYKMLEKYHYLKFYKKCKKILEDGIVTDKEVQDLEMHEATKRIPRKPGQKAGSDKHSDLYTDENPKGTIHGLGFVDKEKATQSVSKIKNSGKTHAHKIQAAIAMSQRAKVASERAKDPEKKKDLKQAHLTYQKFINNNKKSEQVKEEVLQEAKSVAFAFGRFNPPTIGHEKLISKVKSQPTNDYKIYLSRSEDPKKNPLSPRDKLSIMKKLFPSHARNIEINATNMVLDLATDLYKKGYTDLTMVAGSDRVREFETILKKYNGVKSRHGMYDFENIKVVSAGERDPDAEGATGMSASKMRAAAAKGDLVNFKKGLPRNADATTIMKQVRRGMKLSASFGGAAAHIGLAQKPIASLNEFEQQQIRDLYIREVIFNIGDSVKYVKENIEGKIVRKGTNYIVVEDNKNNLHKAWIWDCIPEASDREVQMREHNLDIDYGFEAVSEKKEYGHTDDLPQDKDVKKQKGTQPKKYYKTLSKDVKDKRASHFRNTDTTKNDNDPAPGDKTAKTKPSKHTTKYKKMFGELRKDLQDACWDSHKQVGTKMKGGKVVPNCVPKSEDNDAVKKKDVKEWASAESTIDKYRERYKEEWRHRLDEVVSKMIEKL